MFVPNVGIGTSGPTKKLEIVGTSGNTLKIVDGNQAAGKILVSDANGVATWTSPSAASTDDLATVTGRGATTSTASTFSGGLTASNLTVSANAGIGTNLTVGNNALIGGSVGIGTTSPTAMLDVAGTVRVGDPAASTPQWTVEGGVSGGDMVRLKRSDVTAEFGWSLSSGQMSFRDVPSGITPLQVGVSAGVPTTTVGFNRGATSVLGGVESVLRGSVSGLAAANLPAGDFIIRSGQSSGNANPSRLLFETTTAGASSSTLQPFSTRMVIDGNGNVGIGTTSPAAQLEISSASTNGSSIFLSSTDTGGKQWSITSTATGNTGGAGNFALTDIGGARRLTILSSNGNVGIGSIIPATKLDIVGGNGTTLKIVDGNQGTGKILSSDASGVASWVDPTTLSTVSIATTGGLTGGTITSTGTISLATIANNNVLANTSGSAAVPVATTVPALLNTISPTQGTILYRNASTWVALSPGTSGQFLKTNGAGADPAWASGNAGTMTSVTAGTGLTGGTITTSGTIGLGTELTGLNALATTGFVKRTGAGAYSTVTELDLTTDVTGILPIANGGTNASTASGALTNLLPTQTGNAGKVLGTNGTTASWVAAATGTVTNVATGTGLTGGAITNSGTISLANIADATMLANVSGSSAAPTATTLSALIDKTSSTQGSVLYRNGSNWVALAPGTNGQVLTTSGAGANPTWTTPAATGVTSVATAGGLTGGTITGTGTISLANIADDRIMANISGGSAAPVANTLTGIMDAILGSTQGSIIYRNGSSWTVLTPGLAGQVLQSGGTLANPSWVDPSSGSLSGTGTANYVARWSSSSALTTGALYDNGSYVGIGTNNPVSNLDLSGSFRLTGNVVFTSVNPTISTGGSYIGIPSGIYVSGGTSYFTNEIQVRGGIANDNAATLVINGGTSGYTNFTGNVGIGSAAPSQKLDVAGNVKATAFISTSDRRLKKDIETSSGLDTIMKLRGVKWHWKSNGVAEYGTIAQEVEEVMPELVITDKASGYKAVKYTGFIAPLIEATKELNNKCEMTAEQTQALQAQVDQHSKDIGNLKRKLASVEEENARMKELLKSMDNRLKALEEQKK